MSVENSAEGLFLEVFLLLRAGQMIRTAGFRRLPFQRDRRREAEGEAAPLLQARHGRVGLLRCVPIRAQHLSSAAPDEEAGSLQWQCLAGNRDRVQGQANVITAPAVR